MSSMSAAGSGANAKAERIGDDQRVELVAFLARQLLGIIDFVELLQLQRRIQGQDNGRGNNRASQCAAASFIQAGDIGLCLFLFRHYFQI